MPSAGGGAVSAPESDRMVEGEDERGIAECWKPCICVTEEPRVCSLSQVFKLSTKLRRTVTEISALLKEDFSENLLNL
jgi:hypothetical protein